MKTYEFRVVLTNAELSDPQCEALYEAGCDDGTIVTRDGVSSIVFDREAESLEEAIRTAIENVQAANLQAKCVEIEVPV